MNKNELKIKIEILVLLLPYLDAPIFIYANPMIADIFNYWKIATIPLIILLYLGNNIKPSRISWLTGFYGLSGFISVLINRGDIADGLITVGMPVAIVLIMDYCSRYKVFVLEICTIIFEVLIYSNLISIILYPNGVVTGVGIKLGGTAGQTWYVLGMRNNFILFLLPGLTFAFLYMIYSKNYKRAYYLYLATLLQIILTGSATSLLVVIVFGAIFFIPKLNNNLFYYLWVCIGANILIVLLNIQNKLKVLKWFITKVLKRSLDFTNRTEIWKLAIKKIKLAPIFGYGNTMTLSFLGRREKFSGGSTVPDHAHNHWLQVLIYGGFVGLISYVILLTSCIKKIEIVENKKIKTVMRASLAALFVLSVTQPFIYQPRIFFLYSLSFVMADFQEINEQ